MASKTLTAKVNIDVSSAASKIDSLIKKINQINAVVNKPSGTSGLEKKIEKALLQQEKLRQATAKTKLAEEKVSTQKQKTVEATSRALTAEQKLALQTARTADGVQRLNNQLNQTNGTTNSIIGKIAAWASNQKMVTSATKSTNGALSQVVGKLKMLASTYLGIMGMKAMIGVTDTMIGAQNRLNYSNAGILGDDVSNGYSNATIQATQEAMDKMYVTSQKVRMSYTDMMANVGKFMTLAPQAFQNNADNAIRFQEIMAKAYAIGGASAAEMSSSMYQLTQALGAGVLAGDELRSVREGAPLAYKAIEKFAQGVYNTEESLKELASQGKITSDMVVAAIMNSGNELDTAFAQTSQTFGQTWEQIKNAAKKAFEPVAIMLRDMLNKAVDNGLLQKVETFFNGVSKCIQIIFKIVENTVVWIANNWNWLKNVLVVGLSILISYFVITKIVAIACAIASCIAWAKLNWQITLVYLKILLVIIAIGLLLSAFILFKTGAVDCCTAICIALLAIAIICFLIFGWVVALIVAAVALVLWGFEYVCWLFGFLAAIVVDILSFIWNVIVGLLQTIVSGVVWLCTAILDIVIFLINLILGIVLWLLTVIVNSLVGLINACIQIVWLFVEPFIGIIEFILNVCNGGFNSFGGAVANLIGQIISWFLSLGKVVTKIIDAIFGTNWTSGLDSLQKSVLSWGKNDKAITISREAPEIPRLDSTDAFTAGFGAIGYLDAGAAADGTWNAFDGLYTGYANPLDWGGAAYDWGSGIKDGLNDWGSQFQTGDGMLDNMGEKLGLNFKDLPSSTDPAYGVDGAYNFPSNDELLAGVEGIGDDTKKISDSMDLSNDDLEYLRKIAEMEWRNEFTTAEIKVDMTNNNTVTGERDLDGIVSYLSDVLREEMTSVAYGDHY